jgi:hypothetical protein
MALTRPTELRFWDKEKAYNGYTLFSAQNTTYLIDMEGNVINTWPIGNNPRLIENGNLMDATGTDNPKGFQVLRELDWDGNPVWEYHETREGYSPHHDFRRIYNKKLGEYTTLFLANKRISHEEAVTAGCDPANGPYDNAELDAIIEIDMDGNIIWEYRFFDHLIQDLDPLRPDYAGKGKTIADYPGRMNMNLPGRPLRRDWLHCNSLDYNDELDQIVTNSVQGEFWVIDHGSTFVPGDPEKSLELAAGPLGDFLYRFGDPARYGQGDPPEILEDWTTSSTGHKQIGGSHDIQWIKPGLPGERNFLLFNNGQYLYEKTPQSYIFEINPFLDSEKNNTGDYVNPPDAGYYTLEPYDFRNTHKHPKHMSNQIVWTYTSKGNQAFFSHIGSGCQRLPNNNTLICAMTEGHIFEVTHDGELVWEYINPVTKDDGIVGVIHDRYPNANAVFRAYRYSPDHPGLKGKSLVPKGRITELGAKKIRRN